MEKLKQLKETIIQGSGERGKASQHRLGKLTARERIDLLLDENSFVEYDIFVHHRATTYGLMNREIISDGVVTGSGTIDGRLVYIFSQDFTIMGGSLGEMHAKKISKVQQLALQNGAPIIGINDSGGARVQEGIDSLAGFGEIFNLNVQASGVIPQISIILGPCAGGAVYSPALMDFIFMVDQTSKMFITGPDVIQSVTGETTNQESLGGAQTHNTVSGVSHFMYKDEHNCFDGVRELLSFLPSNNKNKAPANNDIDNLNKTSESLNDVVPAQSSLPYDVKDVIIELADHKHFFEVQERYAMNAVIGFIRLAGKSVGIIANQPRVLGGCLDINASDKIARFVRTCDCFNIPLLTIEDVPGFLPGIAQEHNGIIRHGAKVLFAYSEASVPMVTLITRKAYGGAYIALGSKHLGADFVYAWPTAKIAVMGAQGAVKLLYRKALQESDDPEVLLGKFAQEYEENTETPYLAANRGYVDDIIEPSLTRHYLIRAFDSLENKRTYQVERKHGNIPL